MHLVEIDVIHFEAAKTRFDFRHDVPAGEAYLIRRDRLADERICIEANFRCDYEVFSTLADNSSEDFLRRADRINISGIKKIAADLDIAIEDFAGGGFICLAAKGHASEAQFRNFESSSAESPIFHCFSNPPQLSFVLSLVLHFMGEKYFFNLNDLV